MADTPRTDPDEGADREPKAPIRWLAFTPDGVPPVGRVLVTAGRICLVETTAAEVAELPAAERSRLWAPGQPVPSGIPALREQEAEVVSAAALAALPKRVRPLDGASWGDPRAVPPDPPR